MVDDDGTVNVSRRRLLGGAGAAVVGAGLATLPVAARADAVVPILPVADDPGAHATAAAFASELLVFGPDDFRGADGSATVVDGNGVGSSSAGGAISLPLSSVIPSGSLVSSISLTVKPVSKAVSVSVRQRTSTGTVVLQSLSIPDGPSADPYGFIFSNPPWDLSKGSIFLYVDFSAAAQRAYQVSVDYLPRSGGVRFVAPTRVYDSRPGGARKASGSTTKIAVADVPFNASAALLNITVVDTVGQGFAAFYAGSTDPSTVQTSTINWFGGGQILATATPVPYGGSSGIGFKVGGGGSTHIVVDLVGYVLGGAVTA